MAEDGGAHRSRVLNHFAFRNIDVGIQFLAHQQGYVVAADPLCGQEPYQTVQCEGHAHLLLAG